VLILIVSNHSAIELYNLDYGAEMWGCKTNNKSMASVLIHDLIKTNTDNS
jgi:hypothetical protein